MDAADRGARSREDEASRFVAEQWKLEYREAHTLSIDPVALGILDAVRARALGAFPLALEGGRPVFALAEPTTERLEAVRAVAGEQTSFVVVSAPTLDALLNSRIFNPSGSRAEAAAPPPPAAEPPPVPTAATHEPTAAVDAAPAAEGGEPVEADAPPPPPPAPADPVAAQETPPAERPPDPGEPLPAAPLHDHQSPLLPARRLEGELEPSERRPLRPTLVAVGPNDGAEPPSARLGGLIRQITADATALAARADQLTAALEESQLELRNARRQLEEARAEVEAAYTTTESLRGELARADALNEAVTQRLRELVGALEAAAPGAAPAATGAVAVQASTRIA